MFNYLITLKIPVEAMDDVSARNEADILLTNSIADLIDKHKAELKLQRLLIGKQPEKVNFIYGGRSSIG